MPIVPIVKGAAALAVASAHLVGTGIHHVVVLHQQHAGLFHAATLVRHAGREFLGTRSRSA